MRQETQLLSSLALQDLCEKRIKFHLRADPAGAKCLAPRFVGLQCLQAQASRRDAATSSGMVLISF